MVWLVSMVLVRTQVSLRTVTQVDLDRCFRNIHFPRSLITRLDRDSFCIISRLSRDTVIPPLHGENFYVPMTSPMNTYISNIRCVTLGSCIVQWSYEKKSGSFWITQRCWAVECTWRGNRKTLPFWLRKHFNEINLLFAGATETGCRGVA